MQFVSMFHKILIKIPTWEMYNKNRILFYYLVDEKDEEL